MKHRILLGWAAASVMALQVQGAPVFAPPAPGELPGTSLSSAGSPVAAWSVNTLYVRDGTQRPPIALHSEKNISELDIADISGPKSADLSAVEVMRLDVLRDPLLAESLGKISFSAPPASVQHRELMAIAWLFAIGLIGIATVGRRKKP